jgi:hypothetical protein
VGGGKVFHMKTTPDINWILSTTAQSTAALLAIIGGFLISRLVSLSSERDARLNRVNSLKSELKYLETTTKDMQQDISEFVQTLIFSDFKEYIFENLGTEQRPDFSSYIRKGLSKEVLDEYFDDLVKRFSEIVDFLNQKYSDGLNRPNTLDYCEKVGLPRTNNLEESILSFVVPRYFDSQISVFNNVYQWNPGPYKYVPKWAILKNEDLEKLLDQKLLADAKGNVLENELEFANQQLREISNPKGLRLGLVIFGVFGISGILIPLYILNRRPLLDNELNRSLPFYGFSFGFISLILYIFWLSRIGREKDFS